MFMSGHRPYQDCNSRVFVVFSRCLPDLVRVIDDVDVEKNFASVEWQLEAVYLYCCTLLNHLGKSCRRTASQSALRVEYIPHSYRAITLMKTDS